jgi:hypothetical protein
MSFFDKLETPQSVQRQSLLPSTSTCIYDLTRILNKKNKSKLVDTIPDLQFEIKTLKI